MRIPLILIALVLGVNTYGQLKLEDAVSNALRSNHQILVARGNVEMAENASKPGNAGLLPTLSVEGGYQVQRNTTDIEFAGGLPPIVDAQGEAQNYNLGLALNYTLFDGLGTFRSFNRLKEQADIADIQARLAIESTLMQVINAYYDVLRATEQAVITESTMKTSADRLQRLEESYSYGAGSKINVLNAQVDFYNDSSNHILNVNALDNAKRRLNVLMGKEPNTDLEVDRTVIFSNMAAYGELSDATKKNNTNLLLVQSNLSLSELDLKINRSTYFPRIGLNATYGLNGSESNTSILVSSQSIGFTGGVSLSWNLFSGQTRQTAIQNAQVSLNNNELLRQEAKLKVSSEFESMFSAYRTNMQIIPLEEANVEVSNLNMQRTKELYQNGQATQVEFRQAQLNLLRAQSKLNQAKYSAKITEFELKRLAGQLIK